MGLKLYFEPRPEQLEVTPLYTFHIYQYRIHISGLYVVERMSLTLLRASESNKDHICSYAESVYFLDVRHSERLPGYQVSWVQLPQWSGQIGAIRFKMRRLTCVWEHSLREILLTVPVPVSTCFHLKLPTHASVTPPIILYGEP